MQVRKVVTDVRKLLDYIEREVRAPNTSQPAPAQAHHTHISTAEHVAELFSRWQEDLQLGFDQLESQPSELSSLNFRSPQAHKPMMELRVLIEVIIRLPLCSTAEARKPLCDSLRSQYRSNTPTVAMINRFETEYQPSKAVFWYSSETCFYRDLNSALRQSDYGRLVEFAFFIRDIYHQLYAAQKERPPSVSGYRHVFRGQMMPKVELDLFVNMANGQRGSLLHSLASFASGYDSPPHDAFLSSFMGAHVKPQKERVVMKSFLSTSKRRDLAEIYLSDRQRRSDPKQAVLMQIDLGNHPATTCASVAHLSQFGDAEDEVIFMPGTVFRLHKVTRKNYYWLVELEARQVYEQTANALHSKVEFRQLAGLALAELENDVKDLSGILAALFNDDISSMFDLEELFAMVKTKLPAIGKATWTDVAEYLFVIEQYDVAEKTFQHALTMGVENGISDDNRLDCYEHLMKLAQKRGDSEEYQRFSRHKNMLWSKHSAHTRGLAFDELAYLEENSDDDANSNPYLNVLRQYSDMARHL